MAFDEVEGSSNALCIACKRYWVLVSNFYGLPSCNRISVSGEFVIYEYNIVFDLSGRSDLNDGRIDASFLILDIHISCKPPCTSIPRNHSPLRFLRPTLVRIEQLENSFSDIACVVAQLKMWIIFFPLVELGPI